MIKSQDLVSTIISKKKKPKDIAPWSFMPTQYEKFNTLYIRFHRWIVHISRLMVVIEILNYFCYCMQ